MKPAIALNFLDVVSGLAKKGALVLAIDDLDRADEQSRAVVHFTFRRMVQDAVLLLTTAQSEPLDFGNLPSSSRTATSMIKITLDGLDSSEVQLLVKQVFGGAATSDPELVENVTTLTGGNPRVLTAALASLQNCSAGVEESAAAFLANVLRQVTSQLAEDARAVLNALAVAGDMDGRALGVMTGLANPTVVADTLVGSGLIWSRSNSIDTEFGLVDSVVKAVIDADLPEEVRRQQHARAARALPEPRRWFHPVMATGAFDDGLATKLDVACTVEAARGNLVRASTYTRWAASLSTDADKRGERIARSVRLLLQAGRDDAALDLNRAVEDLPPSWRRAEARGLLAMARGRLVRALELVRVAVDTAPPELDPEALAQIQVETATVGAFLGSPTVTTVAARRALTLTARPETMASGTAMRASGSLFRADLERALESCLSFPRTPNKQRPG